MNKRWKLRIIYSFILLLIFLNLSAVISKASESSGSTHMESIQDTFSKLFTGEPADIRKLREQELVLEDEGHVEYYFSQLDEDSMRCYRQMLDGIRQEKDSFYLSFSDDNIIDRSYHALMNDHPELFWIHNHEKVYKTTYSRGDYCLFEPGYSYSEEERETIRQCMENAYQEVLSLIPEGAGEYEITKVVYTYLIDQAEYVISDDDQSIAGIFWKKNAVCAGYAGAMQYLLERLGIWCILAEGDSTERSESHAWNIVRLDGEYYYADVTNGDQPEFLTGDAVQMAEHKTIIYDYLCPFPEEYESCYRPREEFSLPRCTARDKNFYVLNQGCFDTYGWQEIYEYCKMRLNNGAAVVRFKFSNEEAYQAAAADWVQGSSSQEVAQYYMQLYGLEQVEYHSGALDSFRTIYYIF